MSTKESKPEEAPQMLEEKDDRWQLTRGFGRNTQNYWNYMATVKTRPIQQLLPRPVHSSLYLRELPLFQGWIYYSCAFLIFFRKLPFANPFVRVGFFILGYNIFRDRRINFGVSSIEDIKEARQFDMIYKKLFFREPIRLPDFTFEEEDWYDMNKPGYRVPVSWEYSFDSWMRFLIINRKKYEARPVQWNGKWEQENTLNIDLHAPHSDHWLSIH